MRTPAARRFACTLVALATACAASDGGDGGGSADGQSDGGSDPGAADAGQVDAAADEPRDPITASPDVGVDGVDTRLDCGLAFALAPEPTVIISQAGSEVSSVVGLSDSIGGVGVLFQLHNNAVPDQWVNVLEPRSAAGAGWQTSHLIHDDLGGAGIIVFNQAAGNSVGSQWGYTNAYSFAGNTARSTRWNPLVSDHIHLEPEVHSPCTDSGYLFDDGKVDVFGAPVPTPTQGTALVWENNYSYRARVAQSWPGWSAEQAFYLSKSVAAAGDLRIFLVREGEAHGPIRPYERFTIPGATCQQVDGSKCNTPGYDYAVLVWNIFGLDVGIAIPDLQEGVSLNLEETVYCASASDHACGNINFHSWLRRGPLEVAAGETRTLSQRYYVGTLPQLAELGFPVP